MLFVVLKQVFNKRHTGYDLRNDSVNKLDLLLYSVSLSGMTICAGMNHTELYQVEIGGHLVIVSDWQD